MNHFTAHDRTTLGSLSPLDLVLLLSLDYQAPKRLTSKGWALWGVMPGEIFLSQTTCLPRWPWNWRLSLLSCHDKVTGDSSDSRGLSFFLWQVDWMIWNDWYHAWSLGVHKKKENVRIFKLKYIDIQYYMSFRCMAYYLSFTCLTEKPPTVSCSICHHAVTMILLPMSLMLCMTSPLLTYFITRIFMTVIFSLILLIFWYMVLYIKY